MGDHPTGVAIYAGIVTALLNRERTGKGGMVHTSLLANGLWSAAGVAQGVMAGGDMVRYRAVNTDAKGRFRLTGYERGIYTLRARRGGFQAQTLERLGGGETELRIELARRPR